MRLSAGTLVIATLLTALSGCTTDSATQSDDSNITSGGAERKQAFATVKTQLAQEAQSNRSIKTVSITIDANTPPSLITSIVPPKNMNPECEGPVSKDAPCIPKGATPVSLEGTYWMRGNPLPDYLLSFANTHWTTANNTPYGYLSTSAPGSFAWKEKIVAKGAAADDVKFVPESCRVPKDDPTLVKIAHNKSTFDKSLFARPVADDLAEIATRGAGASPVSDADVSAFLDGVDKSGQLPLDGAQSVQALNAASVFYEAKWNTKFTESSVVIFGLVNGPTVPPTQVNIPEEVASFSLAPHLSDKDIYMRKSFIQGVSKTPNYYLLTRIVDGAGNPTPHYKEFLQCVQDRSQGRLLKVTLASAPTAPSDAGAVTPTGPADGGIDHGGVDGTDAGAR